MGRAGQGLENQQIKEAAVRRSRLTKYMATTTTVQVHSNLSNTFISLRPSSFKNQFIVHILLKASGLYFAMLEVQDVLSLSLSLSFCLKNCSSELGSCIKRVQPGKGFSAGQPRMIVRHHHHHHHHHSKVEQNMNITRPWRTFQSDTIDYH